MGEPWREENGRVYASNFPTENKSLLSSRFISNANTQQPNTQTDTHTHTQTLQSNHDKLKNSSPSLDLFGYSAIISSNL
jgi:hypothetical protein